MNAMNKSVKMIEFFIDMINDVGNALPNPVNFTQLLYKAKRVGLNL